MKVTASLVAVRSCATFWGSVAGCSDSVCDPTADHCTYAADVSTITVASGVEDEDTCHRSLLRQLLQERLAALPAQPEPAPGG